MSRCALAVLLLAACGGSTAGDAGAPDGLPGETRPGKRSQNAFAADPASGRLLIFGGDTGPIVDQIPQPVFVDDTWVLDPAAGWHPVAGDRPSARARAASALDPAGRVLVFGGRWRATGTSGDYTLDRDLWAFDLATESWSLVDDGSSGPSGREIPVAAFDATDGALYVYGGDTDPSALGIAPSAEVWRFQAGAWSPMAPGGDAPVPRHFMASTFDGNRRRLIIFGGQPGNFVDPGMSDLYALDLGTMTWSQLHPGGAGAPPGRFSATLAYDAEGDRYLLFGGHADPGVTNDLWAFDPDAGTWSELAAGDVFTGRPLGCLGNPAEIPDDYVTQDLAAPERRASATVGLLDGALLVFGGQSDCSDHLDDTWRYSLSSPGWSELLPARSGESCARRNDDCACLCL
ncbi:MAG TPA: kelch repeat-containing protein [Kofleriaceae bacterium]|nr:kelch repeat-containing protein [Kofleriaceae bacterium]